MTSNFILSISYNMLEPMHDTKFSFHMAKFDWQRGQIKFWQRGQIKFWQYWLFRFTAWLILGIRTL